MEGQKDVTEDHNQNLSRATVTQITHIVGFLRRLCSFPSRAVYRAKRPGSTHMTRHLPPLTLPDAPLS